MSLSFYSLPLLSLCPREQVYFELIPTSWQFKYTRKHLGNYNIYDQFAIDAANGDLANYSALVLLRVAGVPSSRVVLQCKCKCK